MSVLDAALLCVKRQVNSNVRRKKNDMDRSPKCHKCSTCIDQKADALPKEDWPMTEWRSINAKAVAHPLNKPAEMSFI